MILILERGNEPLRHGFHRWNMQRITAVLMVLCALIGGAIFFMEFLIGPMNQITPVTVKFNVSEGSSVSSIARSLEKAELIRNHAYFTAVTRLLGVENKIKAGYYEFNTTMSIRALIRKLVKGEVLTTKLTIPEGLTVKEMAQLVQKRVGIPVEAFLTAVSEYKPEFMTEHDVNYQVEGFLFPDTYQLPYNVTAKQLVKTMVNRFVSMVGIEPVEVRGRTLSIWEVVTIASLIEEEAKLDEDRPKISGVIYNRLDQRMNLQLCASVLYVLGVKKERLSLADTKIDSPYNTYQNPGLPPGPISNPGMEAIRAAMNPADVEFLFYISTSDGTTYYSKTYEEHLRSIRQHLD
jgi:UPF0755 protein